MAWFNGLISTSDVLRSFHTIPLKKETEASNKAATEPMKLRLNILLPTIFLLLLRHSLIKRQVDYGDGTTYMGSFEYGFPAPYGLLMLSGEYGLP